MQNVSPSRIYRLLSLALLLACASGMCLQVYMLDVMKGGLARQAADQVFQYEHIEDVLRRAKMTTYTTTWTSGGNPYTVSTTCRENEQAAACVQRFDEAVAALQAIHPADPPR